jgi:hypothetical protein
MGAYGAPVFAVLREEGVTLINDALEDYIAEQDPVLLFKVVNGDCIPNPSASDQLVFEWEACVNYYVVVAETLDVYDFYPGSPTD